MAANPLADLELGLQLILGFLLAEAAGPAVRPFAQDLSNAAWAAHPSVPPDAVLLAEGVAQRQIDPATAAQWAKDQGFDQQRFNAMVNVANTGPGAAYAFELWRRNLIDAEGFKRAIRRLGVEEEWVADLAGLHDTLLSSAELAMLQQQGFIDAGRANAEGLLQGVTNERQQLRFEASGLPPGVETALAMLRRKIIDQGTFGQIVREGHTKTKYTDELLQLQEQVLSAATYVRAHLKGHATQQEMYDGGALTGYAPADLDLWYLTEGRPATVHQIHIGYARGAELAPGVSEREAVSRAVKQSDVRPEYEDLLWASRTTYPSLFQLTRLVEGGTIDPQTGADWAHKAGLADEVVQALQRSWSGGGGGSAADPHVSKAQTQLWNRVHTSYLNGETDAAAATTALGTAGVSGGAVAAVLHVWDAERALVRKQLTPAQVKKAYKEGVHNPDTNAAWTFDDAVAELVGRGYSHSDAVTFLTE